MALVEKAAGVVEPRPFSGAKRKRSTRVEAAFAAGRASEISGVPYRTLDYWARSRFLTPSLAPANGKGTQRQYSFNDLIALRVARELRTAGVSRKSASFADTFLVSDGRDVFERRGDELVSTLRRPDQLACAWLVDLGQIAQELRQAAVTGCPLAG